ncbi:CotH kinase family protein [Bacteroidota bacterium]
MEIHDSRLKINTLKRISKKFGARRIFSSIMIFFLLVGFGFGCIVYGAYLNKTDQTSVIKMFLIRLSEFNFNFIPNYVKGQTSEIDNLYMDIKFTNWEKIRYLREQALINGRITEETQESVSAKIQYNTEFYNVDISLTGMTNEHIRHPYKWSLSVKVKGEKTIMGMKKFALIVPQSRGYLTDWTATKLAKSQGVIGLRSNFVNLTVNGKEKGIYYLEERYDKRLIESNLNREGIIFKADDYGSDIQVYGLNQINKNPELKTQLNRLKKLWHSFLNDEISATKIFDLNKLASLAVISDIMNGKHALFLMNLRFYFNPTTGLIEPIGREWGYLRDDTYTRPSLTIGNPNPHDQISIYKHDILQKIFKTFEFKEEYIKQADILTNTGYLDSILVANQEELNSMLEGLHRQNPFYELPIQLIKNNQKIIRENLYPHLPPVKVYFDKLENSKIYFNVENNIDLPIEIQKIVYNNSIEVLPSERIILSANYNVNNKFQEINFDINTIETDFFSADSITVYYNILGLGHVRSTIAFPFILDSEQLANLTPTKLSPNIEDFNFLKVDNLKKQILFKKQKCNINKDLVIPKGYIITAVPGCYINITNSARIISYSPILFFGNAEKPITITSTDSTGQGIVVFNTSINSELSYVNFSYLSNISGNGWDLRGAITFYESPVTIKNCLFNKNIIGDDYLNIIRTNFNIQNTRFINTYADAIDTDFSEGIIENVEFIKPGNDALDVSGTKLEIKDVVISYPGDKGLSAGENSHLKCFNVSVMGGEIAIASKDNSLIEINTINIDSTKIAYCAFQKKPEFSGGKIIATNSNLTGIKIKYLIELGSELNENGVLIKGKSNQVKEMLYGAEYGKSSKQ